MNKERAINILLDFAKNHNKDWYAKDNDALTSAILFLEQDIQKNKKDAKVEVKGVQFNIRKGV
jgi:hypothetical protein|tara:strand:- start:594 stop:782 length:189 start_codon:yes stop_codon:yes gene_type:complete